MTLGHTEGNFNVGWKHTAGDRWVIRSLFTETQHTRQGKSKDVSGTDKDPTPSLHTYTQAYVSQGPTAMTG